MLDLRPKDLRLLEHLIATRLPPSVEVWAYGSRVNGDAYEGSDLDLVLRGAELEEIPVRVFAGFREAVSESNLPILVDVHDWAHLPERFQDRKSVV